MKNIWSIQKLCLPLQKKIENVMKTIYDFNPGSMFEKYLSTFESRVWIKHIQLEWYNNKIQELYYNQLNNSKVSKNISDDVFLKTALSIKHKSINYKREIW